MRVSGRIIIVILLLLLTNSGFAPPIHSCNTNDIDGDGFPDSTDDQPQKFDIYVEVDYMGNVTDIRSDLRRVEESFEEAPISNPDGTNGIDLHIVVSNQVSKEYFVDLRALSQYKGTHFDHPDQGYHYALVVTQAHRSGSPVAGVAKKGNFIVTQYDQSNWTGNVFMHELGHSLGLTQNVFKGIDSHRYDYSNYPSVLNYNSPNDSYGFSSGDRDGAPFDDWEYIAQQPHNPKYSGDSLCTM